MFVIKVVTYTSVMKKSLRGPGVYISLYSPANVGEWFENFGPRGKSFGSGKHILQINEEQFLKIFDFTIYIGEEFFFSRMVVGNKFKFPEKYLPLKMAKNCLYTANFYTPKSPIMPASGLWISDHIAQDSVFIWFYR